MNQEIGKKKKKKSKQQKQNENDNTDRNNYNQLPRRSIRNDIVKAK